jgi:hypothetical protein
MNPSAKQCINRVLAALPQETFRAPAKRVLWPYALAVIVASLAPFVFWPSLLTKVLYQQVFSVNSRPCLMRCASLH